MFRTLLPSFSQMQHVPRSNIRLVLRRTKWWQTCLTDKEEEVVLDGYAKALESGRTTSRSDFVRKAIMQYSLSLQPRNHTY